MASVNILDVAGSLDDEIRVGHHQRCPIALAPSSPHEQRPADASPSTTRRARQTLCSTRTANGHRRVLAAPTPHQVVREPAHAVVNAATNVATSGPRSEGRAGGVSGPSSATLRAGSLSCASMRHGPTSCPKAAPRRRRISRPTNAVDVRAAHRGGGWPPHLPAASSGQHQPTLTHERCAGGHDGAPTRTCEAIGPDSTHRTCTDPTTHFGTWPPHRSPCTETPSVHGT
jgi:hypothetical protein